MLQIKTNKPESLKLYNHICAYMFEQESGELNRATPAMIKRLEMLKKDLLKLMK